MKFQRNVINCHVHVTRWEDKTGAGYIENCDRLLLETGERSLCLQAMVTPEYGGIEQNGMCALYKLHNPKAYAFGGILLPHKELPPLPQDGDPLTQYREWKAAGMDGVKFLYKPDVVKNLLYPINHPMFDPLFAELEKDATPIMWHVADPAPFWYAPVNPKWDYSRGGYPDFRELMEQVFDVMERHPRLRVTFAHFLFLSQYPDVLESLFERYENMTLDVTPGTEMYLDFDKRRDDYRFFFETYRDRILFGTDTYPSRGCDPTLDDAVYRAMATKDSVSIWGTEVRGLGLTEETLACIFSKNFLSRCGQSPAAVSSTALLSCLKKYLDFAKDGGIMRSVLSALQE